MMSEISSYFSVRVASKGKNQKQVTIQHHDDDDDDDDDDDERNPVNSPVEEIR